MAVGEAWAVQPNDESDPRVSVLSNRRQTVRARFHDALYIKHETHLHSMSMWQWLSTIMRGGDDTCCQDEAHGTAKPPDPRGLPFLDAFLTPPLLHNEEAR
jgi:hypothetical protein